jgi:hypothetical protein
VSILEDIVMALLIALAALGGVAILLIIQPWFWLALIAIILINQ